MSRADYGGQRRNMEDASMVGTLEAQAAVVWPLEREVLRRRLVPPPARVLDLGCGTGEALRRFRRDFAPALAVGVDLFAGHLARAEPPKAVADGFRLPFGDATFDLVMVRHLLQALPEPVALLREARRVLREGGRIHLLLEDYGGLFFDVEDDAVLGHFHEVMPRFRARGTDLYQGRRAFRHLVEAGFRDVSIDPVLVDTLNSDRETMARIFVHWRDGYAGTLAELLGASEAEVRRRFDRMADCIRDPRRYAGWLLLAAGASVHSRA